MRKCSLLRPAVLIAASGCLLCHPILHAQDDGGFTPTDGGRGRRARKHLRTKPSHASFTLTLHTE